jgi:uncharacterized protein
LELLALSLAALLLGPVSERIARRAAWIESGLDGFVLTALVGLIAIHILPHNLEVAGPSALAAALVGLLVPLLLEHRLHHQGERLHRWLLIAGFLGYAVHSILDGFALASGHEHHDAESGFLGVAVVLHRIPVGLAIWWLLRPAIGKVGTMVMIGIIAGSTILGFVASDLVLHQLERPSVAMLQALVAGSLLHVTLHPASARGPADRIGKAASGIGALIAAAVLIGLASTHPMLKRFAGEVGAGPSFVALFVAGAPAILFAFGIGSLLKDRRKHAKPTGGAIAGLWRGVVSNACGAAESYRKRFEAERPDAFGLGFLGASSVSLLSLGLSLVLLGPRLAAARALITLVLTWIIARAFGEQTRSKHDLDAGPWASLDHAAPAILLGFGIAAFAEPMLEPGSFATLPLALIVPAAIALVAIVPVGPLIATPIFAVLLHKGLAPGAVLAALVATGTLGRGPIGALYAAHGRSFTIKIAALTAIVAGLAGLGLSSAIGEAGFDLHHAADAAANWIGVGAAVLTGGLFATSLLRQGLREFAAHLLGHRHESHDHHDHSAHEHGHAHAHEHTGHAHHHHRRAHFHATR